MRSATILLLLAACGGDRVRRGELSDPEARAQYPTLAKLYDGEQGIYRGCGPNGGVCHNGNEFPNLDSVGSIVDSIGRDCNQKRDTPDAIHDMCEQPGDLVEISGEKIEIAWIVPVDGSGDPPRTWTIGLRHAPATMSAVEPMPVWRDGVDVVDLGQVVAGAQLDAADRTHVTITLTAAPTDGSFDLGAEVASRFQRSGLPQSTDAIRVGDPNRNGVFGAELGAKLIKPGDPQRSYLLRRLTDPTAGPLMPRANCCFWSKAALRAMWCWVAGLKPDASNAQKPIDYDHCPASPAIDLDYPEPGEGCEASGHCPVVALGGTNEPTFPSIYTEILVQRCSGDGCHDREPFGGNIDMRDETSAYQSLLAHDVVPGNPDASMLVQRLTPAACMPPMCDPMPLDRPALSDDDVARIRAWIEMGATP